MQLLILVSVMNNAIQSKNMLRFFFVIFSLFFYSSSTSAVEFDFGTKINFSGRVFEPGCQFNNGKDIDIDFKKIGIKNIDGVNYTKTINVDIVCKKSIGKKLYFQIQGDIFLDKKDTVITNKDNLGISFKDLSGNPINLNTFYEATEESKYGFMVVPVKGNPLESLIPGNFTAVATLVSTYF